MASSDRTLGAVQDLVAAGNLSVILAFRSQNAPGISYRLLRADVDEGFRRSAVDVATAAMRKLRDFDTVRFEATRLLGPDELFIRSLDEAGLAELASKLHQPALLDSAGFRDFDDSLSFYAFVFQERGAWAALVRQAYQVHVSGIHKLIAVFRQQRLTKPSSDQRVLRFDDRFDMVIDAKNLFVLRQEAFETLFVDREAWKARVPAQVDLLVE